jgi:hypothetical protein
MVYEAHLLRGVSNMCRRCSNAIKARSRSTEATEAARAARAARRALVQVVSVEELDALEAQARRRDVQILAQTLEARALEDMQRKRAEDLVRARELSARARTAVLRRNGLA